MRWCRSSWRSSATPTRCRCRACPRSRSTWAWARPRPTRRFSRTRRSEEHTSELQSLMRISYAVFCLKKKTNRENLIDHITAKQHTNAVQHTATQQDSADDINDNFKNTDTTHQN